MRILVAESRTRIESILASDTDSHLNVLAVRSVSDGVRVIKEFGPHIAFVEERLEGNQGALLLSAVEQSSPDTLIVVLTDHNAVAGNTDTHRGVTILIQEPLHRASLSNTLKYLMRRHFRLAAGTDSTVGLVGISPQLDEIKKQVPAIAKSDYPVLLLGETGTGKELLARTLHLSNTNRKGPFVTVDCASLSPSLIENELFGHAKGAYTGADSHSRGLVQEANGGTLFLDEVGELPLESQTRLLRLLQEKQYRPLGSVLPTTVDVRVIAATNVNLQKAINDHRFREDLYFRLNTFPLILPPLRDRIQDIPFLIDAFAALQGYNKPIVTVDAMRLLMGYHWPGNVRELQNVLVRTATLADKDLSNFPLRANDFTETAPHLALPPGTYMPTKQEDKPPQANDRLLSESLADCERTHILRILANSNFDKLQAARRLGIGKTTLYRKLKQFGSLVVPVLLHVTCALTQSQHLHG